MLSERLDRTRPAVLGVAVAAVQAAVYVPLALFRLADGDEGIFLLASRLVAEGKVLYDDFYFHQMWVLPYLYGGWMKLFGPSWLGGRLLSALVAVAIGLLVFGGVARVTGSRATGALAATLLATSSLAFGWYPAVKNLGLPTFFAVAAWAALTTPWRRRWLWSGLALGLAVASRVYVVALVPVFLYELLRAPIPPAERAREALRFAAGVVLALAPAALFLALDPSRFYFGIVGGHLVRTSFDQHPWWDQKTLALRLLFGIGAGEGVVTLQFILVFFVALASWTARLRAREPLPLSSLAGMTLLVASWVPTPVYTQYACLPLPFLVLDAVVFGTRLAAESRAPALRGLLATLAVGYALVAPIDLYRWTGGDRLAPGLVDPGDGPSWRLGTVREVASAVDRHTTPDRPVAISFWPGYLVETRAGALPGMETNFALETARRVTPAEAAHYHLMSYGELMRRLEIHEASVGVVGNWTRGRPWVREQLQKHGYRLVEQVATTEIYALPAGSGGP